VPFIATGPSAPEAMRSLIELPRVIAEAVGLESHPWDRRPAEVAVAQFDSPGEHDDPRKLDAIKAWGAGPQALDNLNAMMESAIRDGTKLLRRNGELKLYDLNDDPLEERPRPVEPADAPADLLAALDGQAGGPVVAPAADAGAATASDEELARIEEQMRTLGYL
jgi:hypothetical protein